MDYQVVLERNGLDIETLYWTGSLNETRELARRVAVERDADVIRILQFDGGGQEVLREERPFGGPEGIS